MTHILIMSGTVTGGAAPGTIAASLVTNENTFGAQVLSYGASKTIRLTRAANISTFGAEVLAKVILRFITQTRVTNVNTIGAKTLDALPFVPVNAETTALIAAFDSTYSTTSKSQMDKLITELKSAGVWAKLDWYGNAYWANSEHDALLDWINPARSLYVIGAAGWTPHVGLHGTNPTLNPGRYASGWDVGDGSHSTNINLALFCKIVGIDVPQNGMLPMGCWTLASPGPSTPFGSFLSLSPLAGTGFAGAYCANGEGNNFAVGDGLGVWATSRGSGINATFKDGVQVDSDAVATVLAPGVLHPDGICVAGSTGSGGSTRSFPGTIQYWGWSSALTAANAAALENAFALAIAPPAPLDDPNLTKIVIAAGNVGATLTDFPLIVNIALLKASFKANINSTAGNLRAYAEDGTTLLYLDVIAWDGTNGTCAVKVPSLSDVANTTIKFKIDASPTQPAVGAAGGRNGVWADYECVVMCENTSFVDHAGKVTFTVDGTPADITSVAQTDPLFPARKALWFTSGGVPTNIGEGIICTIPNLRSFTFSVSAMLTFSNTTDNFAIASLYNNLSWGQRKSMAWRGTDSAGQDSIQCWDSDNSWFKPAAVFIPTVNVTRFRATLTYSGNSGTRRMLFNGPDGTIGSASYSSHPVGDRFILGTGQPGSTEPGNFHAGFAYVRSGVLSDHWLRAEYRMLTNPALIYTPEA